MRGCLAALAALVLGGASLRAGEIGGDGFPVELPPYLPEPLPAQRAETIPPDAVAVTLDGAELRRDRFVGERSLNGMWKFSGLEASAAPFPAEDPAAVPDAAREAFDDAAWDTLRVPMNWYEQYPKFRDRKKPYLRATYRTRFLLDPEKDLAGNRRVVLRFENVNHDARLYVNGRFAGRHEGEFVPFELDVTDHIRPGDNTLAVRVYSDFGPNHGDASRPAERPYGTQWGFGSFKGGIYNGVALRTEPELAVREMLVTPDLSRSVARVDWRIVNPRREPVDVELAGMIVSAMKADANAPAGRPAKMRLTLAPGENRGVLSLPAGFDRVTLSLGTPEPMATEVANDPPTRWELGKPHLYFAALAVKADGRTVSMGTARFGFREMKAENGRFYLNGRRVRLYGESSPTPRWSGFKNRTVAEETAMMAEVLLGFARNGVTVVRTPHQPATRRFLDLADEIGLLVMHEWAWSFTKDLGPGFAENNLRELADFVRYSYNHPSVAVWSLGNEVKCIAPGHAELFRRQYALVRELDRSGRPVNAMSGGSHPTYCAERLDTDILSFHDYVGLTTYWPAAATTATRHYAWLEKVYAGADGRIRQPLILDETVGYSWGFAVDKKFRIGDVDAYAQYAAKQNTWGAPQGIGFAGYIGLARALAPGGDRYARALQGRRVLGLLRLDDHLDGVFPWFHSPDLDVARLWTQPLYAALLDSQNVYIRNLFAGQPAAWTLAVANSSDAPREGLRLRVDYAGPDGRVRRLHEEPLPKLAPWAQLRHPATFAAPAVASAEWGQLRVTLVGADGRDAARNYHEAFVQAADVATAPVAAARPVFVLDPGAPRNVAELADALAAHGVAFTVVRDWKQYRVPGLLVVPAGSFETPAIRIPDETLGRMAAGGGVLLVMEQRVSNTPLPGADGLAADNAPFADLVSPRHPLFAGLDQRNFDSWHNDAAGAVCRNYLTPFTTNALAAKGPVFHRQGSVGSALNEAANGKGRVLLNQLNVMASRKTDSSAATYFRNLLAYAAGPDDAFWPDARPLAAAEPAEYDVDPARLVPLDLRPFANRSFTDDTSADGQGGWTDEGDNDFRNMPLGRRTAAGVLFDVIDPAANDGRSCIVLRGGSRPAFLAAAKGIPVGMAANRLFFLHTATWVRGGLAATYRIHYADGTRADFPILAERHLSDWWNPSKLPEAKVGLVASNPRSDTVGTFVVEWVNPHPEKVVASFDFLAAGAEDEQAIDYLPVKAPIPVLVAATAERSSGPALDLTGAAFKRVGASAEKGTTVKPVASAAMDGASRTVTFAFPASPAGAKPVGMLWFDAGTARDGYGYLVFRAKSDQPVTLRLRFPQKDWKNSYAATVRLRGGNEWRTYRLASGKALKAPGPGMEWSELRGEAMVNYLPENEDRPAATVSLADARLE